MAHVKRLQYNKSSFLVSIPREFVQSLGLQKGQHVTISLEDTTTIRIRKLHIPTEVGGANNAQKEA